MPQTLYPSGTLKKIVKAHANRPLSKNVDILVRTPFCTSAFCFGCEWHTDLFAELTSLTVFHSADLPQLHPLHARAHEGSEH